MQSRILPSHYQRGSIIHPQVEWRKPTTSEAIQIKVQKAKAWLTGEGGGKGGATDQDVKDAC